MLPQEKRILEVKTDYTNDEKYMYHAYDCNIHTTTTFAELENERE